MADEGNVEQVAGNEGNQEGNDGGQPRNWEKDYQELNGKYEKETSELKPYKEWTDRVYSHYQKNPDFKQVLEDVLGGKEFKLNRQQAQAVQATQNNNKPQVDPEIMKRLEKYDTLEQKLQSFERQQKTAENLREIQTETSSLKEKFGATDEDINEFYNRLGGKISQDANRIMQTNPGMSPQQAQIQAARRYAEVLTSQFVELMPEKMSEFYTARNGQRTAPQRGVNTPADRVKRGSSPSRLEQLQNKIQNSSDQKERVQARLDLAEEMGVDPADLFSSQRAGKGR